MSSIQIAVRSTPVAINYASMGSLSNRLNISQDSPHQHLPSAFILLERDPSTFEQSYCEVMDCLVAGSSAAPLLTLCLASIDICLYWVFNPLDPKTREYLELFRREQAFPFIIWDGELAMPCTVRVPMFDKGLRSTRARKPSSHKDWLAQAHAQASSLPGIYASMFPGVAYCRDHRVFLTTADESMHLRLVDQILLMSAALKN